MKKASSLPWRSHYSVDFWYPQARVECQEGSIMEGIKAGFRGTLPKSEKSDNSDWFTSSPSALFIYVADGFHKFHCRPQRNTIKPARMLANTYVASSMAANHDKQMGDILYFAAAAAWIHYYTCLCEGLIHWIISLMNENSFSKRNGSGCSEEPQKNGCSFSASLQFPLVSQV